MKFSLITFFYLLLTNFLELVFCDCKFSPQLNHPYLIIQKIENTSYLIESSEIEEINIADDEYIDTYCDYGFRIKHYYGTAKSKNLKIRCINGNVEYEVDGSIIKHFENLDCKNGFGSFYPFKIPHCDGNGFLYGVTVKDTPIIFAEFCYDIRKSNLIFAHYFAGQRSPILENQKQFNSNNVEIDFSVMQKFTFFNKNHILGLPSNVPLESSEFIFGELVKFQKYSNIFKYVLNDKSEINTVIWWRSLKNGNWKLFEELLENQSIENNFDIYAGKSDIVTYPEGYKIGASNEFLITTIGGRKKVPLLMWFYIKYSNTELTDKDFVVIGVNSPFFECGNNNIKNICKDVCDEISWMEPLSKTRKLPGLGYIFCCKPNEVKHVLEGFPNIIKEADKIDKNTENNLETIRIEE